MSTQPNQKVLFLELSAPTGGSVGGSFFSLLGLLELFPELRNRATVSFYFDNHVAESVRTLGFEVRILRYFKHSRYTKWLKRNRRWFDAQSSQTMQMHARYSILESIWQYYVAFVNSFEIARVIRSTGADIVYCNSGINIDRAGILAAIYTGKKICCHLRGYPVLNTADKLLAKKVDLFVAISESVSSHYRNELAGQSISIHRIYNPIGTIFEQESARLSGKRNQLDRSSIVRVACFSRIIWWKGQECLINAFRKFLNDGGDAVLLIYGKGPDRQRLERLVRDLDMTSYVTFKSYAEDVVAEISKADIIVNPSIRPEPLGRVIIEGMVLGRATIATNLGGAAELIVNGFDGLLVEPDDTESIASALRYLCDKPRVREQMGRRAREKALREWNSCVSRKRFRAALNNVGMNLDADIDKCVE